MADAPDPGRTLDEETLRYLSGVLGGLEVVRGTSLFPANRQESLVVTFDDRYYPGGIDDVRLELRAYTNGDFHVSYVETYLGEVRQCRWDRHEQDQSTRDHFHPPPSASTADAEDLEFPGGVTTLLLDVVFPWVSDRLGMLWNEESGED